LFNTSRSLDAVVFLLCEAASDSMVKSHMSMQSVELFPMSPTEIQRPASRLKDLKEMLANAQLSLQNILSFGQCSDTTKLTNKSVDMDNTDKETSRLQPDPDSLCNLSNDKTSNCDDMSVSDAVLDLSEIIEEEEEQDDDDRLERERIDENCLAHVVDCSVVDSVVRCVDDCDSTSFSWDTNHSKMNDISCRNSIIHPRLSAIRNCATPSRYKLNHIAEELQQSAQSFVVCIFFRIISYPVAV